MSIFICIEIYIVSMLKWQLAECIYYLGTLILLLSFYIFSVHFLHI